MTSERDMHAVHGFSLDQDVPESGAMHQAQAEKDVPVPVQKSASQAWMLTFADLVSLMLTFFVMLFAMSSVQVDRWETVVEALSKRMEPAPETEARGPAARYNIGTVFRRKAINLDYLHGVLADLIADDPRFAAVALEQYDDRLIISIPAAGLYRDGTAILTDTADTQVREIGAYLRNLSNQIQVIGHAEAGTQGEAFTSNWELSVARASAVANALKAAGYPDAIIASGAGGVRSNGAPEGLPADRVDVAILPARKGF